MSAARAHESILARLREPGSARHLAFVRIVLGLHLVSIFSSPAFPLMARIGTHPHPMTATWFPAALEALVAENIEHLVVFGVAFSVAMTLGLGTRVAVPLVFVLFVLTQNYWFRSTLFHDDWLYFTFPLLVLSFARSSDVWAIDRWLLTRGRSQPPALDRRQYRWPVEALVFWFAFVYVSAGISKLFPLAKGIVWLSGISAQEFAVQFVRDSPAFFILGHAPFDLEMRWPFTLGAIGTVVVELSAGTLLFTERHRLVIFGGILGLHISIFMLGIPSFPQMALVLGVALIPTRWFRDAS